MKSLKGLTGFLCPQSLDQALELLRGLDGRVRLMAGGTDIMSLPRSERPGTGEFHLIDLSGLDLDYIKSEPRGLSLGAGATMNAIAESDLFSGPLKALAEAAQAHSTHTIRNRATLGGNICTASPGADSLPALLALDAVFHLAGPAGTRSLAAEDFFIGPNCPALAPDEILTEVFIPAPKPQTGSAFLKLRRQQTEIDLALVNAAARLTMDRENCLEARLALGAVGPAPFRAQKAEAMLQGRKVDKELIAQAASQAAEESAPLDDARSSAAYRKRMAAVLAEDVLLKALERSRR